MNPSALIDLLRRTGHVYVVPWKVGIDQDGGVWIDASTFSASSSSGGTTTVRAALVSGRLTLTFSDDGLTSFDSHRRSDLISLGYVSVDDPSFLSPAHRELFSRSRARRQPIVIARQAETPRPIIRIPQGGTLWWHAASGVLDTTGADLPGVVSAAGIAGVEVTSWHSLDVDTRRAIAEWSSYVVAELDAAIQCMSRRARQSIDTDPQGKQRGIAGLWATRASREQAALMAALTDASHPELVPRALLSASIVVDDLRHQIAEQVALVSPAIRAGMEDALEIDDQDGRVIARLGTATATYGDPAGQPHSRVFLVLTRNGSPLEAPPKSSDGIGLLRGWAVDNRGAAALLARLDDVCAALHVTRSRSRRVGLA